MGLNWNINETLKHKPLIQVLQSLQYVKLWALKSYKSAKCFCRSFWVGMSNSRTIPTGDES